MERRKDILYAALFSTLLLTVLQVLAFAFYFYWNYWWYDFVMHFLGGLTGGLSAYWVLFHSGFFWKGPPSKKTAFTATLFFLMAAGIAWEIAEFKYGILDSQESYPMDVANDLIMDASGATLAVLFGLRRKKNPANLPLNG
jgi:hypothetical protein